eukprot:scaffold1910_cov144-Skeletonema_marinoi.AAC.4
MSSLQSKLVISDEKRVPKNERENCVTEDGRAEEGHRAHCSCGAQLHHAMGIADSGRVVVIAVALTA